MFFTVLFHELAISSKNFNKPLSSFLFFIIFIFVAGLLQSNNSEIDQQIFFWLATICVIVFSSADFLKNDFDSGMLEQMAIACYNFEIFIFAKIIANWLNYCAPIILTSFFINHNFDFVIITIIASFTINVICCFCGSFSLLGNSSPLISIIALPLIIPIILMSQDKNLAINILSPLSLILFLLLSFLTAKIVKIFLD